MKFGKGCKQPLVAPHRVRVPFRLHATMATPPTQWDQRQSGKVAAVKDQNGLSACEGHACSGATETYLALAGQPLGFVPSEADLYRGARAIARARQNLVSLPPLTDDGAQTEDVLSHMATYGIRPRYVALASDGRNSDVEVATVNAEETIADLEADAMKMLVGPYAVDPTAADAAVQVKAALAANIPVRVDAFVDSAFENWQPGDPPIGVPNTADPNGGGHAIYLVGYTSTAFILRNSWGVSYGYLGDCLVSFDWVKQAWGIYPWLVHEL